jgi:alpha-L-rhamnosidase
LLFYSIYQEYMRIIVVFFFWFLFPLALFAQDLQVVNLACEQKQNPLGVERKAPVLSWQLQTIQRGVLQSAYRILVADNIENLNKNIGNLWDSKKRRSDVSIQVAYEGKPLQSSRTYYWKVQVWDNKHSAPRWSKVAQWQMGLLASADWKNAQWIAYEEMADSLRMVPAEHGKGDAKWARVTDTLPLLRKEFNLEKPVKNASAFICGLGHFEMSLNGRKVGDHFLDPGWTQYDREAQYVVFDLTNYLKQGSNAIGVMLGNGFYFIPRQRYRKLTGAFGFPKMILRLNIQYADGTTEDIVSDASWKTAPGPITFSSIYGGEDYNANLEQKGWDTPSFNDRHWRKVVIVKGVPTLYSQQSEPIKVHETFSPVKTTKIKDSTYVFDLGQNASGIPQITVRGKKGDTIRIIPAELLREDGTANQRATGSPVYFDYVLKGEGVETWQPRFSYYGFRYLQVEGGVPQDAPNPKQLPVLIQVKGLHTRNAARRVGTFTSSHDLFNRTSTLIDWAIKSNMASVLTDCPHREKLGWLEQVHLMGNSIRYNYDMVNFFRKIVRDMMAAQSPKDVVPEYAPEFVKMPFMDGIFMDSPEWGSTSIILPWYLYQWYGDRRTMEESYPMMQRYLEHLKRKSKDHILAYGLSDWYDLGPNKPGLAQLTPMGITATAIYYCDLNIMTQIARLLGKEADAREYTALAAQVKRAFNKTFFNMETKQYGTGSQTANAMAVYMKLVEPEYKDAVVENIIKDIRSRNNSLTTGDVGFRYLLKVLDEEGRSDVIYDMNSRADVPGYGYQLAKGATSLTESWQALPTVSNNHLMLGHLMEWFYTGLAGIRQDEGSNGFKHITIRPEPVGDVRTAKATYESPYGLIKSEWKKEQSSFELNVQIPANTTATVYLPAFTSSLVMEGGKPIDGRKDIQKAGIIGGKRTLQIGSGNYRFSVLDNGKKTAKN